LNFSSCPSPSSTVRQQGGVMLLDVSPMTEVRGDGHRPPGDCLHYNLPGVVDYWNHLLFSSLMS
jgi:hypothetical protein